QPRLGRGHSPAAGGSAELFGSARDAGPPRGEGPHPPRRAGRPIHLLRADLSGARRARRAPAVPPRVLRRLDERPDDQPPARTGLDRRRARCAAGRDRARPQGKETLMTQMLARTALLVSESLAVSIAAKATAALVIAFAGLSMLARSRASLRHAL